MADESGIFGVPGARLRELRDAEAALNEIVAIVDEPLDERVGRGPTRHEQFAKIGLVVAKWKQRKS